MHTIRDYKVASLRLFYDMVSMDGYVHSRELLLLNEIKSKDNLDISPEIVRDAYMISTAQALNILSEWKAQEDDKDLPSKACSISRFFKYLHALAKADSSYSFEEGRLASAAHWAIEQEARCISIPESKLRISKYELLYIDEENDSLCDKEIKQNHILYNALLKEYGYRLVHIPSEVNYLLEKENSGLLQQVVIFNTPLEMYGEKDQIQLLQLLHETTNKSFVNHFLNIDGIGPIIPSFLFKIKTSVIPIVKDGHVIKERMADYVMIPIDGSHQTPVLDTIRLFTDTLRLHCHHFSCHNIIVDRDFISFRGFHKTLLDYIISRATNNGVGRVIFDPAKRTISFSGLLTEAGNAKIELKTKEFFIYMVVVYYSTTEHHGVNARNRHVEQLFDKLYGLYSSHSCEMFSNIQHSLSLIKSAINNCIYLIDKDNYIPHYDGNVLRVNLNAEHLYIRKNISLGHFGEVSFVDFLQTFDSH